MRAWIGQAQWRLGLLAALAVLLVSVRPAIAQESPIALCVKRHESAQVERMEGRLLEAEDQLKACAEEVCPDVLRNDCLRWRAELDEEIPSVVVDVRTDDGDTQGATVVVNGELVADKIDGRPIRLNPGNKRVVVALASGETKEIKFVLAQGERNRAVVADFRTEKPEQTRTITKIVTESRGTPTRPIPVLTYIFGGVAVASAGVGTGFGVDALLKKSELEDRGCAPLCPGGDVDALRQSAIVSDVALGTAAATGVAAMIFYFTRPVVYVKEPVSTPASGPKEGQSDTDESDSEDAAADPPDDPAAATSGWQREPVTAQASSPRVSVGASPSGAMIFVRGSF